MICTVGFLLFLYTIQSVGCEFQVHIVCIYVTYIEIDMRFCFGFATSLKTHRCLSRECFYICLI